MWWLNFVWLLTAVSCCSASVEVYSTFEAFTTSGRRCIGDCEREVVWSNDKCLVTWQGAKAECIKQNKYHSTLFVGLDGSSCVSDCDKFGDKKEWCAVSHSNWDYCSRRRALNGYETVQSDNAYSTCLDECTDRGSRYNWCHTGDGSWYACDQSKRTIAFNNPTESGERCITRCKRYKNSGPQSPAYCYTQSKTWSKCFPNPPPSPWDFKNISRRLNEECTFLSTSKDGQRLIKCENHNRRPRQLNEEFQFDCTVNVEDIVLMHQLNSPIVEVRQFNPDNPITQDTNPVLNYHVMETMGYFYEERPMVDLPLNVEAVITSYTVGNGREPFDENVDDNFYAMDVGISDVNRNFDDRGHMIAAQLGGPTASFNIFPQTRWSNRGAGSPWRALERRIERFVRNQPLRYVRMWVVLSYPVENHFELIHRPDAIGVRVRAYDDNQMVDMETGNPVTEATNPTENLFFSNDPARRCRG